jgi:multidrug resistance efflux pump
MRKGSRIDSKSYADPLLLQPILSHSELPGGTQHESQLEMNSEARQGNWKLAESELHRLAELYGRGLISRADLIIGRYRTLRQAQRNSGNQVVSKPCKRQSLNSRRS